MIKFGPPKIRCVKLNSYLADWQALEGSKRLQACQKLNMTPYLVEIENGTRYEEIKYIDDMEKQVQKLSSNLDFVDISTLTNDELYITEFPLVHV